MINSLKPLPSHIYNHLLRIVTEREEALLSDVLEYINYDIERLRFTIKGGIVTVYLTKGPELYYYCRAFQVNTIMRPHQSVVLDYTPVIAALVNGDLELDLDLLEDMEPTWGALPMSLVGAYLNMIADNPIKDSFDWQIMGEDLFSVETHHTYKNINFPLYLLDYAYQYLIKQGALV